VKELVALCSSLSDRQTVIILEAIEAITRETPDYTDIDCLLLAKKYILSDANNLKRESSRIIGNIAHKFPDRLDDINGGKKSIFGRTQESKKGKKVESSIL